MALQEPRTPEAVPVPENPPRGPTPRRSRSGLGPFPQHLFSDPDRRRLDLSPSLSVGVRFRCPSRPWLYRGRPRR